RFPVGPPEPGRPWLPPLPALLPLEDLDLAASDRDRPRHVAAIGLLDDPNRQRQVPLLFDLERDGNLLAMGSSGSGKTTVLRTLAVTFAQRLDPALLHIYGLDFATRGLRPLAALPQCGDVIAADEPERALRLLHLLQRERERRKSLLAVRGASSVTEYEAAGGGTLPRLLVLLDGYAGFRSTFEDVDLGAPLDLFRSLVGEGRPLGMAFAITADRAGTVPTPLLAAIGRRLVLRMTSDDEYLHAGLDRSLYLGASLPPGAGSPTRPWNSRRRSSALIRRGARRQPRSSAWPRRCALAIRVRRPSRCDSCPPSWPVPNCRRRQIPSRP